MSFTKEELGKLQPEGLLRLAEYLGIKHAGNMKKETLIDKIHAELEKRYPVFETSPDVPKYSVRLQKIMEDKKKKGEL